MKEDFLHYLWKFKKFETSNLLTSKKEKITILNSGQYLKLAGPDFFNAQIKIDQQKWAGNVEIHIKSSDWYAHHHERDIAYENVILHVVWEHNSEVFRSNNTEIPVLELKQYVSKETVANYHQLMLPKSWIFCEKHLHSIDNVVIRNWQERLFFERLERKIKPINDLLIQTQNDWDAVLFCLLAKNFGLNTNGDLFFDIANSISFSIIRKESFEVENMEALLFGNAGLLKIAKEDNYYCVLNAKFIYLTHKYQLEKKERQPAQFFKHRPDNFPTIRLSQLANLYFKQPHLFSKIINSNSITAIYEFFKVTVSEYWQTHYQFDKSSKKKFKSLSKEFVDLIIINTIIPIQFAYAISQGKEIIDQLIKMLEEINPENNMIIQKFNSFGIIAVNAFETQSLLQLKNEYCNRIRCMECEIGIKILKKNAPID